MDVAIAIVLVTVTLGGAAVVVALRVRRAVARRREEIRSVATRLGWSFQPEVPLNALPDLERFELFRPGHSKKLRNLMASPPGERRALLFEYQYTVGRGKHQSTYRQTVVYQTRDGLRLPAFSLRPEHFGHKVAGLLGFQDIDFPRRPEFSRLFLLRGDDEPGIRAAFADEVLRFFEERAGLCATGVGDELLVWRTGKRASPEEIPGRIAEGDELTARLGRVTGGGDA